MNKKLYLGDVVEYGGRLAKTVASHPAGMKDCGCCQSDEHVFTLDFLGTEEQITGVCYEDLTLVEHPDNWEPSILAAGWDTVEEYHEFLRKIRISDLPKIPRLRNRVCLKEDCDPKESLEIPGGENE